MDITVKNKVVQIESLFVPTPTLKSLLEDIKRVRDIAEMTEYENEPTCILVMGETGTGKTEFIKQYQKKYPVRQESERTYKPVLVSGLPKSRHPKPVAAQLLRDLGDPLEGKGGDTHELTDRLVIQLKAAGTQLIIIDEFHHAIQTQSNQVVLDIADWIKMLINKAKIPIVLFGLPWSQYILDVGTELERRFNMRYELINYTMDTFEGFQKFLQKVQEKLPIQPDQDLWRTEQAFRLFAVTQGNVSNLMKKLIRPAAIDAVFDGSQSITPEHFLNASRRQLNVRDEVNPLILKLTEIVAQEQRSQSYWNRDAARGKNRVVDARYRNVRYGELQLRLDDVF
ncbi:TniB family NTP-binding protein [Neptunomonas qingdaonensis]|uniref:DNA transposition protein, AAA+ family ATPase n=1 Tax=Neptunomonas qingdaonensis TaxID=1045558 RepID=A0A1I2MFA6_9GAMM|nr:TniB family NTP-binding protein [Neptunomonas qingdaonensis]SFF89668.1 DNA transposition protein, AAA+ family ATPase [Neptunomonas qingdaonensis]